MTPEPIGVPRGILLWDGRRSGACQALYSTIATWADKLPAWCPVTDLSQRDPAFAARALRAALVSSGAVATATGAAVALRGTAAIPGGAPTAASNDSVLRFYAVWWAAQGPAMWRLAHDPDLDERALRYVCATTFLGGLARLVSVRTSGRPHLLFQALTAMELLLPPVLLALHQRSQDHSGIDGSQPQPSR